MTTRRPPRALALAQRTAKALLRQAEGGDRDAAAVLLDALVYARHPEVAESIAFALQGRAYCVLGANRQYRSGFQRGAPLPAELHADNLLWAIDQAKRALFPVRAAPCMPNDRALRELVMDVSATFTDIEDPRRLFHAVRRLLRTACTPASSAYRAEAKTTSVPRMPVLAEHALTGVNELLRGAGVVRDAVVYDVISYVDLRDDQPTVLYHWGGSRYHVASARAFAERLRGS